MTRPLPSLPLDTSSLLEILPPFFSYWEAEKPAASPVRVSRAGRVPSDRQLGSCRAGQLFGMAWERGSCTLLCRLCLLAAAHISPSPSACAARWRGPSSAPCQTLAEPSDLLATCPSLPCYPLHRFHPDARQPSPGPSPASPRFALTLVRSPRLAEQKKGS